MREVLNVKGQPHHPMAMFFLRHGLKPPEVILPMTSPSRDLISEPERAGAPDVTKPTRLMGTPSASCFLMTYGSTQTPSYLKSLRISVQLAMKQSLGTCRCKGVLAVRTSGNQRRRGGQSGMEAARTWHGYLSAGEGAVGAPALWDGPSKTSLNRGDVLVQVITCPSNPSIIIPIPMRETTGQSCKGVGSAQLLAC